MSINNVSINISPRFKSLDIAGSMTYEKHLPEINNHIDQKQSETAKAILSLYDMNEDDLQILKQPIESLPTPKRKIIKHLKKSVYFQRRFDNKKIMMIGTCSNMSLDKTRILTEYNTPTDKKTHDLNLPSILTPSKFTIESYSTRKMVLESPARNNKTFSLKCDAIETGCQILKQSIIVNKPKQLSKSAYYLSKEQDRAISHKRDIESLEEKEENKELSELLKRQEKTRIMQESAMVHKMSTSLAFDAKELMKKLFLLKHEDQMPIINCYNSRKEMIKSNVAKMDKILCANVTANQKCKIYLNNFSNKNHYSNTVQ